MNLRNLAIWAVVVIIAAGVWSMVVQRGGAPGATPAAEVHYSDLVSQVDGGQVKSAVFRGATVDVVSQDKKAYTVVVPADSSDLVKRMEARGVNIAFKTGERSLLLNILIQAFPILLLIAVWIFFMRQMQGGARGAMGFGKSKARLLTENKNKVTFDDVAGVEEAKDDLTEIVDFLKDPAKFQRLGGKIPKGALLVGPPGTGKTLLARAIPGEAGVPFFTISGSDFVEMFVGVRPRRVRDHVRTGQEERPLHHLHRRNRRRRPPSRRGPRRRQRRARADPQPAAGRDGRLRGQ